MPFDKITRELAQIMIQFRGPDADFDLQDTYAADYLMYLLSEPNGKYIQSLYKNPEFKIPDFNNSWAQYATVRANGLFEFGTIVTEPENLLPERAEKILLEIQNSIIPKIANEKKFFTESYKSKIIEQLKDSQTQATETPSELLTSIRSWWTNTNAEYFFNYYDNLSKVTQDDVKRIIEKYISGKTPLVSVLLNPEIYNSTKKDFESEGFYEVRSDEKRWWQEKQFELKEPVQNSNFKFTEEKNI